VAWTSLPDGCDDGAMPQARRRGPLAGASEADQVTRLIDDVLRG